MAERSQPRMDKDHPVKVALVGGGSMGFTRALATDILSYEEMSGARLSLIDINEQRLAYAKRGVERIIRAGGYPATVEATTDRAAGLEGADVVTCAILAHGVDGFRPEIEIPMRCGVDYCVGDSYGIPGVFRGLRTIPIMLDICRDIERYAPDAYLLNYTNPMAMLCRAMQRATSVKVVGLCHSVQGMTWDLTDMLEIDDDDVITVCAGLNHQAWVLRFERNGQDLYPLLREAIKRPEVYRRDIVRNEMFLALGYYVTESSGHNSEYTWWFRKRPQLIEECCHRGERGITGRHGHTLAQYDRAAGTWEREMRDWAQGRTPIKLERSHHYAAGIIRALLFDRKREFNGNVANTGLITNLPEGCCVEVPVVAEKSGLSPVHVGALPPQCAALNQINTTVVELAVQAALTGDPKPVYHACYYDPVAAAVCSLAEIREIVDELFRVQAPLLPQFKR